ncbi:MAG: hypothetical protein JWN72_2422, partial [Thermoleophilia bacterium]|nr:hypothetical protein [Thermoleophilia bacterium]
MVRIPRLLALALALLVFAPTASALACPPIPIRTIGAIKAVKKDLRYPTYKKVPRAQWKLDDTWYTVKPRMAQWVKLKNGLLFYGVSFSTQVTPSIDAYAPEDLNWLYIDDSDPDTQTCQMIGQSAWQEPKIWIKETAKTIRFAAGAQHTIGDRRGCVLGPEGGTRDCPILTRTVQRLKKPVGNRTIIFESFT